jgi:predicted ATPase
MTGRGLPASGRVPTQSSSNQASCGRRLSGPPLAVQAQLVPGLYFGAGAGVNVMQNDAALAQGLACTQRTPEALTVIDDTMDQCLRTGEAWCQPELLRIRGRLLLQQRDEPSAELCFRRSLHQAEEQSVLSRALRTALDHARLLRSQGRADEAASELAPIRARFTEGFGTSDVAAASTLLTELHAG